MKSGLAASIPGPWRQDNRGAEKARFSNGSHDLLGGLYRWARFFPDRQPIRLFPCQNLSQELTPSVVAEKWLSTPPLDLRVLDTRHALAFSGVLGGSAQGLSPTLKGICLLSLLHARHCRPDDCYLIMAWKAHTTFCMRWCLFWKLCFSSLVVLEIMVTGTGAVRFSPRQGNRSLRFFGWAALPCSSCFVRLAPRPGRRV